LLPQFICSANEGSYYGLAQGDSWASRIITAAWQGGRKSRRVAWTSTGLRLCASPIVHQP